MTLNDDKQRQQALDISQSFLVQAPAGSGKTGLLIQRYLSLLAAAVQMPEEIIAITFTRKAAAEMKERIIEALQKANNSSYQPTSEFETSTHNLAKKVLLQSEKLNWNLLKNSNRFRILTIDAFCARLTRQMPIYSNFGGQPNITTNIYELCLSASNETLQLLETDTQWSQALEVVLLHLDNDHQKVQRLFISMLLNRDQWLPYVIDRNPRHELEKTLKHINIQHLRKLQKSIQGVDIQSLFFILNNAAQQLQKSNSTHNIVTYFIKQESYPVTLENLDIWKTIANFLLTGSGDWRSRFDKNCGFPAVSSAMDSQQKLQFQEQKNRIAAFMESIKDNAILKEQLNQLLHLPKLHYSDAQWLVLDALLTLLPVLVAQLHILFKQTTTVDHTEIALKALTALGTKEQPTDLTLALDYQIQHILIDEYQDTSINQFRLLEMLTLGWTKNDNRTLFIVGDPMQSIYRFRKAEVGLFLQTRDIGINEIKLNFLQLTSNFRSNCAIVNWNNTIYSKVFPQQDDLASSAISYAQSIAFENNEVANAVQLHPIINSDESLAADKVIEILKNSLADKSIKSIAVLVQARSHLHHIIPKLKMNNIAYNAIELESLGNKPLIQDLYTLALALKDPTDSIAWFSVLRAPWCGLELADLLKLSEAADHQIVLTSLNKFTEIELSSEAKNILNRVAPILKLAWQNSQSMQFCHLLEATWLALGGPAILESVSEKKDVDKFFHLLDEFIQNQSLADLNSFEKVLQDASADSASDPNAKIEIMTIHKSKGLEFDTVILPNLEKTTRGEEQKLLAWQEIPSKEYHLELLLAPIKSDKYDSIYDYITRLEKSKTYNEYLRLLYVATTRPKKNLHLVFGIDLDKKNTEQIKTPKSGSLLKQLWPALESKVSIPKIKSVSRKDFESPAESTQSFSRLAINWQHPYDINFPKNNVHATESLLANRRIAKWNVTEERLFGIFLHKCFELISSENFSHWSSLDKIQRMTFLEKVFFSLQIPLVFKKTFVENVQTAIYNSLNDDVGHWILSSQSYNEFKIHNLETDESFKTYIVDKVIKTNNEIWIIDFKTARPRNETLEKFLQQQKLLYQSQLDQYAYLLHLHFNKPVRKMLFFPLLTKSLEI